MRRVSRELGSYLDSPPDDVRAAAAATTTTPQAAQPGTLPDQVRAMAKILSDACIALPQTAIEVRFKGRGPLEKEPAAYP